MIKTKYKLWRNASAAALIGVSAGACAPAPSQQTSEAPAADEAPLPPASSEVGEGGEQGEAGVQSAYAGIEGPARTALRMQHLKGFLLVAQRVAEEGETGEAAILASQGVLEVYEPAQDQFAGFDAAPVHAAADGDQDSPQQLSAAVSAIDRAQSGLSANPADIAARMTDMATGLYQHVLTPDGVDPIEYQHSLGMALAARDALVKGEAQLRARNPARYREAVNEVDRFIALWPAADAPDQPTAYQQVVRQSSRVRLALSAFL